jgi:menaquinone-dependent protoporphyrinogen oxidase
MTNEVGKTILVAYATKRGSTHEVAEAVAETLRDHGLAVEVRSAAEVRELDRYDGAVVGGALYMGRWHRDARRLLSRFRRELEALPVAVFGMGPLTSSEQDVAGSREQLDRALERTPELEPVAVAIFGGVVHPQQLHFPLNRMPESDARDWDAIQEWAVEVAGAMARREVTDASLR